MGEKVEGVIDPHTQKAMELFEVSQQEVTLPMRDIGKLYNYMKMYGKDSEALQGFEKNLLRTLELHKKHKPKTVDV